jgi:hypothetical protein
LADSALAYTAKNYPVAVCGIPVSGRLAAIFAGLEPQDFDILRVLQAKLQAIPHSNLASLCLSSAAE